MLQKMMTPANCLRACNGTDTNVSSESVDLTKTISMSILDLQLRSLSDA